MAEDPIFLKLSGGPLRRSTMVTVAFRIPQDINDWAEQLARQVNTDKSVCLRELLIMGWIERQKLMNPETDDGQRSP